MVSLLFLHSTCAVLPVYCLCIVGSPRLLSRPHVCPLKLKCTFLLRYHGLWCPVCCSGWFSRCALVNSVIWLVTLPQLLLPACTHRGSHQCSLSNFTPFPCTCCSAVQVSVCTVLLATLGRLTSRGLLHRQTVGSLHLPSVSVCNTFLAPYLFNHLVLLYLNFTFSLSSQISPRQPQQRVVFTNKLSIHTSYLTHRPCVNLLSHFSCKNSPNFPSPSSFLHIFHFTI